MSLILIMSYRLKEVTNSNVLHCLEIQRFAHISGTRSRIVMGFGSKCRSLNGQVDYIEISKLNIADMRLISLDRVTYVITEINPVFDGDDVQTSILLFHHTETFLGKSAMFGNIRKEREEQFLELYHVSLYDAILVCKHAGHWEY